jgi:predicted amidohydrolase
MESSMLAPKPMRVAAVQMDVQISEVDTNLKAILARFREAVAGGARLVVFPECALTGYGFNSKDEAMRVAEPIPGLSTRELASACAKLNAFAIYGLLERDGDRLYNATVLIGPTGLVGSYRKVHLPFLGVDRFVDPGDRPFEVLEIDGLRVGMHICYDGSFPETGRVLTLLGADLLVLPTNWPIQSLTTAEHLPATRAIENVVYVMAVDRVGEERGCQFAGTSSIAGPGGEILAKAGLDTEEILYADVDPAIARRKRLVRVPGLYEIDRIADRRPGFYGPIVAPNGKS